MATSKYVILPIKEYLLDPLYDQIKGFSKPSSWAECKHQPTPMRDLTTAPTQQLYLFICEYIPQDLITQLPEMPLKTALSMRPGEVKTNAFPEVLVKLI